MELVRRARSAARIVRLAARAVADPYHPILAQIVPMRRCNLACAYCNEYDKVSDPVPLTVAAGWLDRLAWLGTEIVTVSGGEPLLHPDMDAIIAGIRRRGMIAGLITNGYFLQRERIRRLNAVGLEHLQISIDNVKPDQVSQKSLKILDAKLVNLAEEADFGVNVNVVLGSGCADPEDALRIARRARELGFSTSVGIIHGGDGRLQPLGAREREVYDEVTRTGLGAYTRIRGFQKNLVEGRPNDWHCRAGARYLYICEEGRVHYCSQRRGEPGVPLAEYGPEDIRRAFHEPKDCAPYCTIGCVHRSSSLDRIRPRAGLRGTMDGRETASP